MPATSPKRKKAAGGSARNADDGDVSLQVMVPARIKREVSLQAAQNGTTLRTVILTALKSVGFTVRDDELCDKRKTR